MDECLWVWASWCLPASPAALQVAIAGQEMLCRCISVSAGFGKLPWLPGSCVLLMCSVKLILRFVKKELGLCVGQIISAFLYSLAHSSLSKLLWVNSLFFCEPTAHVHSLSLALTRTQKKKHTESLISLYPVLGSGLACQKGLEKSGNENRAWEHGGLEQAEKAGRKSRQCTRSPWDNSHDDLMWEFPFPSSLSKLYFIRCLSF